MITTCRIDTYEQVVESDASFREINTFGAMSN